MSAGETSGAQLLYTETHSRDNPGPISCETTFQSRHGVIDLKGSMVFLILRGVKNILRNPCVRDGGTPLADFLSQKSFWIWVCSGLWRPPLYGPGRKKTFDTLLFFDLGYHY